MLKTILLAMLSVMVATAGQLLLRAGMVRVGRIGYAQLSRPARLALQIAAEPRVLLGLGIFAVSAAVWLIVLSRAPLSLAYPFAGLTYVLTALFSRYVLHESIPGLRWMGILFIIAGIVLVGRTAPGID